MDSQVNSCSDLMVFKNSKNVNYPTLTLRVQKRASQFIGNSL
jgi:hypothetical protein